MCFTRNLCGFYQINHRNLVTFKSIIKRSGTILLNAPRAPLLDYTLHRVPSAAPRPDGINVDPLLEGPTYAFYGGTGLRKPGDSVQNCGTCDITCGINLSCFFIVVRFNSFLPFLWSMPHNQASFKRCISSDFEHLWKLFGKLCKSCYGRCK